MPRRKLSADIAILALLMIASLALKLRHLGHPALTRWDESYHAIVARNLLQHPLTPTLTDTVYFPDPYKNWTMSHIWLHKPILPLWQIAASFSILGVNTLALRLPSALLSVASIALTYLIGTKLLARPASLIAAALQAFSPVILGQVQGYLLADHIDTSLLFYLQLAIYFLLRAADSGKLRGILLAGIATGLAYLSKDFLALLIPALAIILLLSRRLRPARIAILLATALLTLLPWTIWCFVKFRPEFLWEHAQMLHHVNDQIGGWSAPWYRVAYTYLGFLFGWTYLPLICALCAATITAIARRDAKLFFLVAWCAGVILSTLFAVTKTPLAAIPALPAACLLIAWLIQSALRADRFLLPLAAAIMICCVLWPPHQSHWQEIMPTPAEFPTHPLTDSIWLAYRLAFILLVTLLLLPLAKLPSAQLCLKTLTLAALLILLAVQIHQCFALASINLRSPNMAEVAAIAHDKLPSNAVLLVAGKPNGETENLAFHATQTVYFLQTLEKQAGSQSNAVALIRARGGNPFIISPAPIPAAPVAICPKDGFIIYAAPAGN